MGEVEDVLDEKKQQKADWLMVFLIGITLVSAVGVKVLSGRAYSEFVMPYGLTIMLLFIIFTGVSLSKWNHVLASPENIRIGIGYVIGLALILASIRYPVFNLWFLGSALIGVMVNDYLGISIQFILSYLYCGLNGHSIERMLFYFILGSIICFLGKYLYKASTAVYVMIIVLSCNIIFLFVMNSFVFQDSLNENALYSVASTFAVLLALYGIITVKGIKPEAEAVKRQDIEEITEEPIADKQTSEEHTIEEKVMAEQVVDGQTTEEKIVTEQAVEAEDKAAIYDEILSEDYELLQQLRAKSPSLYVHSERVAELAVNGAAILECDEKIAEAGGLYHEIGRVISKDYITEGVKLLEEQAFPQEVIDILRQQNAKAEIPKSKEAAIVMLAESVVSTVTYLEKEKKKALAEGKDYKEQPLGKVVENIFDIRFNKGSLDESGITILEYKKLKNYYMGIYS